MLPFDVKIAKSKLRQHQISVLPDFFLDIIVDPHMEYDALMQGIQEIFSRGGGNLLGPEINFVLGGNGGNVVKTLGGLGALTSFISKSSPIGKILIEHFLHPLGVSTYINPTGKIASSVILEIPQGGQKRNVMLSWAGSVAQFSANELTDVQWEVLHKSRIIAITNAQNLKLEHLVDAILSEVSPQTQVSVDFSDLSPHLRRINGFRERLLDHPTRPPTWVLGNETEICLLAQQPEISPEKAIQSLSKAYPETVFALHTAEAAQLWSHGELQAFTPCHKIVVLRATGAGDAWHAGFLLGVTLRLDYENALRFANATAAYQISTGQVGTLDQILHLAHHTEFRTRSENSDE